MFYTKMKLTVVVLGVLWCGLLIYVMSLLNWNSGGINTKALVAPDASLNSKAYLKDKELVNGLLMKKMADETHPKWKKEEENKIEDNLIDKRFLPKQTRIRNGINNGNISSNVSKSHSISETIKVVISGDSNTLIGLVAAVNSVDLNTNSPLHFYITLPKDIIPDYVEWIRKSRLRHITQTVRPHPHSIPKNKPHFAKIYFMSIFPELEGRVIYLDSDVIVQGDISELTQVKMKGDSLGAFSQDCTSVSKRFSLSKPRYSTHVNLKHPALKNLKAINPVACTFNTDIFVANVTEWKKSNISAHLQNLVEKNKSERIYGVDIDADEAEAAILIIFYHRTSSLPHLWHVGQLGIRTTSSYSAQFIKKAKLLHWDGHFKPWSSHAAFLDVWQKYYVASHNGHYRPVRKKE